MSVEDLREHGQAAFSQHRFEEARRDYIAILQEQPDERAAMDKLVRIYLAQENPVAAKAMLARMEENEFPPTDAAILQGEVALMQGHFEDALTRVANLQSAQALRIIAIANIGLKQPAKTADAFESGRRAPGNKGRLLADYAHFKFGTGDLASARQLAALAAKERPVELLTLMVNADLAMNDSQFARGLEWYERAINLFPDSRPAALGRIAALAELGRFEQVRPIVEAARAASPHDNDYLYLSARLAAQDGNWEKVREMLQPHERGLSAMPAANMLYANAMMEIGQGEQARSRLSSQLLREPGNRQVRVLLGEAKLKVGDLYGAVETLEPIARWPDATDEELALLASARAATGA
ncbi:MAG: tetratricopeptide repeat protein [Sphingomonadaceae bacterium]|nr:tetratricopeptide repeat protein [Sphingomonadaceae bacterium]